jgi:2-amino-4-hydroxy-6-hydroxymethyldihydropteridine diphosphokinase
MTTQATPPTATRPTEALAEATAATTAAATTASEAGVLQPGALQPGADARAVASAAPRAAVFIGLGANLGDARATLAAAVEALRELALADAATGMKTFAVSSLWRSAPVEASGPDFLNAVARLETSLAPHELLDALQAVERRFGRERPYRNAPRTLDLDVLLYGVAGTQGGLRLVDERIELPHPRAARRAFVLAPLAELWPDGEIPGAGRIADLLARVRLDVAQRIERVAG